MVAPIRRWARAWAVGHASPAEIDAIGIMAALRLAGHPRAGRQLDVVPDLVILDGNHDWLTDPAKVGLFAFADGGRRRGRPAVPPVTTLIKADMTCSSVAAASVLAKVERDAMMVALAAEVRHVRLGAQQGVLRARAPGRAVRARSVRAPPQSWRLPGCPGSRTASSRRTSRPTRTPRGRRRWRPSADRRAGGGRRVRGVGPSGDG